MNTVREIALSVLPPGYSVKGKERSGEAIPTYDVWAKAPGAKRGHRAMVITFPTLRIAEPVITMGNSYAPE